MLIQFRPERVETYNRLLMPTCRLTETRRDTLHPQATCDCISSFCIFFQSMLSCIRNFFLSCFGRRNVAVSVASNPSTVSQSSSISFVTGRVAVGNYNQYNIVSGHVGDAACPHLSAEAALAYLSGRLTGTSREEIDQILGRGIARLLAVEFSTIEQLQQDVREMNPIPMRNHQDFDAIAPLFPELEDARDFTQMERIAGLDGAIENMRSLQDAICTFANLIPAGERGASLLTSPPNTYGLFLKKSDQNEIEEVMLFESHGSNIIGHEGNGAFVETWCQVEGEDAPRRSAELLFRLIQPVPGRISHFNIIPVRLSERNSSFQ